MPGPDSIKYTVFSKRKNPKSKKFMDKKTGDKEDQKGRGRIFDGEFYPAMAKGGRAGYKMGSKCKLATKGKGRAYGKNS